MPTTTNIQLSTPAHGANVDTWNADPINNNSLILDIAFGTVTTKSLTNAPVTLSATEAQAAILRFTGTLSGNVAINVSAIRKSWICENNTLGAFVVTITGGSGNVVALPEGSSQVYWDGTNVSFINLGRIGEYWDDAGSDIPAWVSACTVPPALPCYGQTFSAVTYPLLNKKLGGTTLPDARGRARFAFDGSTNRITSAGSGINGNSLFAAGGAQNVTLGTTNLPPYTPSGSNAASAVTIAGQQAGTWVGQPGGTQINGAGNGMQLAQLTGTAAAQAFTGSPQGGVSTPVNGMPPAYIGGITMIWAA